MERISLRQPFFYVLFVLIEISENQVDQEGDEPGEEQGVDDGEGRPATPYLAPEGGDGGDTREIQQDEHHEPESRGGSEDLLDAQGVGQGEVVVFFRIF